MKKILYKSLNIFLIYLLISSLNFVPASAYTSIGDRLSEPQETITKTSPTYARDFTKADKHKLWVNEQATKMLNIKDLNEATNRKMHKITIWSVNLSRDMFVFYNKHRIQAVHNGLLNFLYNLAEPLYGINSLLQGDVSDAGKTLTRFVLNTTVGILGFYDFTENVIGWERNKKDFGSTLASWGVPAGYEIYVPMVGPMSTREAFGDVVEIFADPMNIAWRAALPKITVRVVTQFTFWSTRGFLNFADFYDVIDTINRTSLDSYIAFREYAINARIKLNYGVNAGDLQVAPNDLEDSSFDLDNFQFQPVKMGPNPPKK